MNKDDLKTKLAAQRKWRETKTPDQPAQRWKPGLLPLTIVTVVVSALITLAIAYAAYAIAPKEISTTMAAATLPRQAAYAPTRIVPSPTPIVMSVCVENLHVRFTPNGSVRGYLRKGEAVTFAIDKQGESIKQAQGAENWILIAIPIEGWANEKYLCK